MAKLKLSDKRLLLNGKRTFLVIGDMQYWFVSDRKWPNILDNLKKIGVDAIMFYIPWIWHEYEEGKFDFDGRTNPKRNVKKLIELAKERGLHIFIRPGPFICSETRHGGISDFITNRYPEVIMKNSKGEPVLWYDKSPLPAYNHPRYVEGVRNFFTTLCKEVIFPNQDSQGGPILAAQIDNELMYSMQPLAHPFAWGYEEDTVRQFREWLKDRYNSIEDYNKIHETNYSGWDSISPPDRLKLEKPKDWLLIQDWIIFKEDYLAKMLKTYNQILRDCGVDIPTFVDINGGEQEYLSPNNFYKMAQHVWLGPNFYPNGNALRYPMWLMNTILRWRLIDWDQPEKPGFCPEQGWVCRPSEGVPGDVYATCMNRIFMALGMEAFSVCYVVPAVDIQEGYRTIPKEIQFMDILDEEGNPGKLYDALARHIKYPKAVAERLSGARYIADIGIGFYPRYNDPNTIIKFNRKWADPREFERIFKVVPRENDFVELLMEKLWNEKINFDVFDIQNCPIDVLKRFKVLIVPTCDYMDEETQSKLMKYVEDGGTLVIGPITPYMNLNMDQKEVMRKILPKEDQESKYSMVTFKEFGPIGKIRTWSFDLNESPFECKPIARDEDGKCVAFELERGHGKIIQVGFLISLVEKKGFLTWFLSKDGVKTSYVISNSEGVYGIERSYGKGAFIFVINTSKQSEETEVKAYDPSLDAYVRIRTNPRGYSVNVIEISEGKIISADLVADKDAYVFIGEEGFRSGSKYASILRGSDGKLHSFE